MSWWRSSRNNLVKLPLNAIFLGKAEAKYSQTSVESSREILSRGMWLP